MKLDDIKLFEGIEGDELETLLQCCQAQIDTYKKDEFVWMAGDMADRVGIAISASVNIINEDILGNRNILGRVDDRSIFGEVFACADVEYYPVSAQVASQGQIMTLKLNRVLTQCSSACSFHAQLIKNLLYIMSNKNLELNKKIAILNKKTTKQKIAHLILSSMKNRDDTHIYLGFSREEMADYLGVNRSALSRELSALYTDGIIEYKKNKFTILDIVSLDSTARE